jgi:hypothetical protein
VELVFQFVGISGWFCKQASDGIMAADGIRKEPQPNREIRQSGGVVLTDKVG